MQTNERGLYFDDFRVGQSVELTVLKSGEQRKVSIELERGT